MDRTEYYAPEFDAACILMQLSGDSHSSTAASGGDREEESVGDTGGGAVAKTVAVDSDRLSASSHGCGEIQVYPLRRKRKFRSISELYAITKRSRNRSSSFVFQ